MIPTPITDAAESEQQKTYQRVAKEEWPAFPANFDFARRLEQQNVKMRNAIKEAMPYLRNSAADSYILDLVLESAGLLKDPYEGWR